MSGIATQAGTFQFYVEMREPVDDPAHCAGKRTQKQFTLRICNRLGVVSSPARSPRAEVGVGFQATLSFCGGMGALTWTVSAGALPTGVGIGVNGTIRGVPRVAGEYRLTVAVTDVLSRIAKFAGTITVAPTLRVRTQRLHTARLGRVYRASLAASGGVGPNVWKVKRGRLPRGIRLDARRGVLFGTPHVAGERNIVVEVSDALGAEATRRLGLRVVSPHPRRR